MKTMEVRVQRYLPEQHQEPVIESYQVPFNDSTSVLDALNYIKEEQDSSLSYRWSCRMAICGSCGFMINGEPKLGCKVFLRDYASAGTVLIAPLDHFPVERDLIVDLKQFMQHLDAIQPYIIKDKGKGVTEMTPNKQTPAQLEKYQQFAACINCGLCYSACPQFGLNPEFLGPGALALAHRYNLDSRDEGRAERMPLIGSDEGAWSCTFVGYCSEVCPQSVDPAAAVNQAKVLSAQDMVLQLFKGKKS